MADEEQVRFVGHSGVELAGALRLPDGAPRGGVVLSHCFTCSKDLHTITRLSRHLARMGWAALRFDFAGVGESGGDFAEESVSRNVQDVVAAAAVVTDRVEGPLCLFGHSLGGAASLLAVPHIAAAASVAVLGVPRSPAHLAGVFTGGGEVDGGQVSATIGGMEFRVSADFLADLERHDEEGRVADLGLPLLVVHSPSDTVVPVAQGEAVFAAARQPKAFVPLLGADHLVSDPGLAARLATLVGDWFGVTTE